MAVLCREVIRGLSGVFGAHARKCFLPFIKVSRALVLILEMSLPSTGESKWTSQNIVVLELVKS